MSKSVRVLLYIDRSHLLNRGIDDYSWFWKFLWQNKEIEHKIPKELRCSHAELWFPDDGHYCYGEWKPMFNTPKHLGGKCYGGECFTSTLRDKKENGVVMRPASQVLTHPEHWCFFEIELTDEEYEAMYEYALFQASLGIRYSKLTIASFFLPWRINQKDADICSEAICRAIYHGLNISDHSLLLSALRKIDVPSPLRLASNIFKCGYPLYSLETGKIILENKV